MAADSAGQTSHLKRYVGARGHLVHHLTATDANGQHACYFLLVEPAQESAFLERIRHPQGQMLNLNDYGKILGSCFGATPTSALKQQLQDEYGLTIS